MENVEYIYIERIKSAEKENSALKKKGRYLLLVKLFCFVRAVMLCFSLYKDASLYDGIALGIYVTLYIGAYIYDERVKKKVERNMRIITLCNNEIKYLNGDYSAFEVGREYIDQEHEFSFDLDLFGEKSLFNRINRTITKRGSYKLAERLTNLTLEKEEIEKRQEAICELGKDLEWRVNFLTNNKLGDVFETLSEYASKEKRSNDNIKAILSYLSVFTTLTILVLASFGLIEWGAFTIMFLFQLFISVLATKSSNKVGAQTNKLHKEYANCVKILKDIEGAEWSSEKLRNIKSELFGKDADSITAFNELSGILNLFDQRSNAIMFLLLNGLFLFDIMLARKFYQWKDKYLSYVGQWIDCIAEVDVFVSFAAYSFNNPSNVMAQIMPANSEIIIDAQDVYHPFLSRNKAVANNFKISRKSISIVTGANMAGKSTMLRTVGLTYIIANNGMPVCATSFKCSVVSLFSSMRTTDNISKDISYFNAELIRLKKLINFVKDNTHTLIILDEILKGTNSKDKLKGSVMFLNEISKHRVSAVIATHDLELSKLEDEQPDIYKNYCFEIELAKEINYSYKIQRGVARNLNASYLLESIIREMQK